MNDHELTPSQEAVDTEAEKSDKPGLTNFQRVLLTVGVLSLLGTLSKDRPDSDKLPIEPSPVSIRIRTTDLDSTESPQGPINSSTESPESQQGGFSDLPPQSSHETPSTNDPYHRESPDSTAEQVPVHHLPSTFGEFTWNGHTVTIRPTTSPTARPGEVRANVTVQVNNQPPKFLTDVDRTSGIEVTSTAEWELDKNNEKFTVIFGEWQIARYIYKWNNGAFELVDVDYYEPVASDMGKPQLLEKAKKAFEAGTTKHKQIERNAEMLLRFARAEDWNGLEEYWQSLHPSRTPAEAKQFAQEQRDFLTSHGIDLSLAEFNRTRFVSTPTNQYGLGARVPGIQIDAGPGGASFSGPHSD